MKTKNIALALVLLLATSLCVLVHANCVADSDCNPDACLNGRLYDLKNSCNAGSCVVDSATDRGTNSACDYCKACIASAHDLGSPLSDVTYSVGFNNEYTIDNGAYIVVPDTKVSLSDISRIQYLCGNGAPSQRTSNLIAWIYNTSSSDKLAMGYNNIEINGALNRSNVISSTSTACGTPVLNAFKMLLGYDMENTKIDGIFNFVTPSNYTVFIDLISGYCGPNNVYNYPTTQNYVCPWLGGTARSDNCLDTNGKRVEGWTPKQNFTVLVPYPDITIDAPSDEPAPKETSIQKSWTIRNTGIGRITMSIEYDCGNWTCAFDGYAQGSQIPLEENEAYTVKLNITTKHDELEKHRIGIKVTYDDGYGLKGIKEKIKTSYIEFGNPIIF
jgi:hypothetical protein